MLRKRLAGAALAVALISVLAFAQQENETYRNDLAVQAFGSFVKSRTRNGVEQTVTNSSGVAADYRLFFNKNHGVEVNYGYALNTQSYYRLGVNAYSQEATAAYVFRVPLRHWSPFALAGGGGVVFDPKDFAGANVQARAAFVYGAGADFHLSNRIFLRAEYRGLVYNSPTFDLPALGGLDRVTLVHSFPQPGRIES